MYKVDIAKLNKRIVIQIYKEIETEWGTKTNAWIELETVWGSVNSLFGKEYWAAKQCKEENALNITIRYQKTFKNMDTRKYRVVFDNKFYNITFIDNPHFSNKFLTLKCSEVKGK